ncbi:MAG: hypothetical protein EHM50_01685, partial [Lysobacterales bacterium]
MRPRRWRLCSWRTSTTALCVALPRAFMPASAGASASRIIPDGTTAVNDARRERGGMIAAMYIPKHFEQQDPRTLWDFIDEQAFGTLMTVVDGRPALSHLPFLVDRDAGV